MSARTGRGNPPPVTPAPRQNEYFVPRDGIDREVITADICRYLGNDALVRPGTYESPQTGQTVNGYFITAYRNLTTAMIEDLKADSARWDQERRQQQTARNVGGTNASSRDADVTIVKASNSPIVQYRNSDTHQSRQIFGPTDGGAYPDHARESMDTIRYPGTGNMGYVGSAGNYSSQAYPNQVGYAASYPTAQPPQFAPQPVDTAYRQGYGAVGQAGFSQAGSERPYTQMNANMGVRPGTSDQYGASDPHIAQRSGIPTTMAHSRAPYSTAGPPQPGYASAGTGYYPPNPPPATSQYGAVQASDPFYGRGTYDARSRARSGSNRPASPAGNTAYGSGGHDTQYEAAPSPRAPALPAGPSPNTQMATSGPPAPPSRHNRDSIDHHPDRQADTRHRHRSGR